MPEAESPLFEVLAPARWHVPAVFNSPHSGSMMPQNFIEQTQLKRSELRQSEDYLVDELFGGCVEHGAPMLRALVSRAWLDLNREPFELDPRMFEENLPGFMNAGSPRVAAGFGTLPRLVGDGLEIYRNRLSLGEAQLRIDTGYRPYHRQLTALVNECHAKSSFVLLVDCHSMPQADGLARRNQPDVVLGDRFGASCASDITKAAEDFFTARGLKVARNKPYAGGFITETHGNPRLDRHALQIELNRGLYMDESRRCRSSGFARLRAVLDEFTASLEQIVALQAPLAWKRAAE